MKTRKSDLFQTIIRICVIFLTGILFGFIFYGNYIFLPTSSSAQFVFSGATVAIFYSILKKYALKNAVGIVLLYYFFSSMAFMPNKWILVLFLVYITTVSTAVYLYQRFKKITFLNGIFQRVASLSVLLAVSNVLALSILALVQILISYDNHLSFIDSALHNFQLGALIGVSLGIGIEVVEYLLTQKFLIRYLKPSETEQVEA